MEEITDREEDMLKVNTLFSMGELVTIPLPKETKSRFSYEFQQLCTEMIEMFGKDQSNRIWALPYKTWFTEHKARRALDIAQERKILTLNYVIGIIRKLP